MFRTHRKTLATGVATALVLGAMAAPAALAEPIDLRTPDARDAADVAAAQRAADLRSPDARDAAEGRQIVASTPVTITKVRSAEPSGFDWGDAAIGAGGAVGVVLVGVGGTLALVRRRHRSTASSELAGLAG
jgi:hypothetical protein